MYQSIYYNRQPGDDQYHYYLRDDKKGINCFQYWPTVYKIDDEGEFETLFGGRCSPINGKYDRKDPSILEKDIDREFLYQAVSYHSKVIALGQFPSKILSKLGKKHFALPHPSGLNRLLNDKRYELAQLDKCSEYLKG